MSIQSMAAALGRACVVGGKQGEALTRGVIRDAKQSYGVERLCIERETLTWPARLSNGVANRPEIGTALAWVESYRVFIEVDGQLFPALSQAVMADTRGATVAEERSAE